MAEQARKPQKSKIKMKMKIKIKIKIKIRKGHGRQWVEDLAWTLTWADWRAGEVAFRMIGPGWPVERMTTRQRPLKALRSFDWKGSKVVASPLSVAIISPGPLME